MPTTANTTPSAQYQALYQATVQEAASGGGLLMGKLVESARAALQKREAASRDLRERDALAESAKQLRSWEPELCKRYPQALLDAFNKPVAVKTAVSAAPQDLRFDQLELMDEVQVLTSVALARTQQVAMLAAEASLAELNTLICSTLGLGAVRPERNPLRPEIYVAALKETVEQTKVSSAVQLDWLGAMSVTLGQELRALYVQLSSKLRAQGVVSAGYAVTQTPTSAGIGRGVAQEGGTDYTANDAPAQPLAAPASSGGWGGGSARAGGAGAVGASAPSVRVRGKDEALLTLDKLRRLLAGELVQDAPAPSNDRMAVFAQQFARDFEGGGGNNSQPEPPMSDFDATVPAALEALTEMKQVDRVVQNLEQRRNQAPDAGLAANAPVDMVRSALRRSARGVAQALSLEVVTLMVDNMARDPRLLEPVQRIIKSLEPALLRLALVDPRFFTDKQHPARELLQDISHRSLAYGAVDAPGFDGFVRQVEMSVAPLLQASVDNAEPFEQVLQLLRDAWALAAKQKELDQLHAVEALKHAEQRNILAEKIAREIDKHPDADSVPEAVLNFLCGPWSQVVAQARITGGAGSKIADKYQALISALLWSVHPDLAHKNISKLTKLVPLLLNTLRDGLETIRYPSTRTSTFLEALMGIHQQAFKAAAKPAGDAVEARKPESRSASLRARMVEDGNPWVAPEEAQASNFIELPDAEPEAATASSNAASDAAVASLKTTQVALQGLAKVADIPISELPLGSWVELLVNDQWTRTQLTWASPHGTLFLFTSVFGTTQSMTRRSRDKLVEAGKLRVISGQPLVEGALDAVAHIAMQNSVDTTL
jgi:hypothetical protein